MAAEAGLEQFKDASCDDLFTLGRITEQAERFEDMCVIMGNLVKKKTEKKEPLEIEQRNMLSVAYKNVVGTRRSSWRTLEQECKTENANPKLKDYRAVIEQELDGKCKEVLALLTNHLISDDPPPSEEKEVVSNHVETQVFYLKMSGDYYRYLAEFSGNSEHKDKAEEQYSKALDKAENLAPTHPTRLGLALNASVCYYEIMNKPNKACELAKKAFDEAIQKLDSLSDSTYKDSTLIMQLLRDNLTIWTSESDNNATIEENED